MTRRLPATKLMTKSTRKTTKQIFAMPADAAAIPPNPSTAAINAITRNTQAYQSIFNVSSRSLYSKLCAIRTYVIGLHDGTRKVSRNQRLANACVSPADSDAHFYPAGIAHAP